MRSFVRSYTGTQFPQSQEGKKKSPETARDNALSSLFYVRAKKNAVPTTVGHKMEWNGRCSGSFLGAGQQGDGRSWIRPKEMTRKSGRNSSSIHCITSGEIFLPM